MLSVQIGAFMFCSTGLTALQVTSAHTFHYQLQVSETHINSMQRILHMLILQPRQKDSDEQLMTAILLQNAPVCVNYKNVPGGILQNVFLCTKAEDPTRERQ